MYYTPAAFSTETAPEFLVNVIVRRNGTLQRVHSDCEWSDAITHAEAAFAEGLQVEVEESNAESADDPLPGEMDRQD